MSRGTKREIISPLLSTSSSLLLPLLIVFSIYLLLRGHNEPGGGFVGGLVAGCAFTLYAIANGVAKTREKMIIDPRHVALIGISMMSGSGLVSLAFGNPFLTAIWLDVPIPVVGKLGTPLLFDVGVYLIVTGIVLSIIFALMEDR